MTPPLARYLAEVDYVDHFAWVAVDSSGVPVGGVTYVRSASDRALADISFLIEDQFQGRGLGTLLMGAVAIAARRNGIDAFAPTSWPRTRPRAPSLTAPASRGSRRRPVSCTAMPRSPTPAGSASRQARRRHWPRSWTS